MSGFFPEDGRDDLFQRYNHRLVELTQPTSLATSAVGSLNESTVNSYVNKNGTLSTHQFYNKNSNQDHRIQENITSNQLLVESSSACVSDASVFKKPLPVKRLNWRPFLEGRFNMLVKTLSSIEDKPTIKFMMRTMETLVQVIQNPPAQAMDPGNLSDYINNLVKEEYFLKRATKSICGSSIMSDRASNIDQCNSERSVRLDKQSRTASIPETRIILQDITQSSLYKPELNRPTQHLMNSDYSSIGRMGLSSYNQRDVSTRKEAASRKDVFSSSQRPFGSTFNLLNDSEIAQRRDEAAASQAESLVVPNNSARMHVKTLPKTTMNSSKVSRVTKSKAATVTNKKPSNGHPKVPVPEYENSTFEHGNKNVSLLNGTGNGFSRSGRPLKAPTNYWNSKGEEESKRNIDESVLNESMTLRNKKVVDKKKTPTLPGITEVSKSTATKKRGRPPLSEKENTVTEKKNPVKKTTGTPAIKSNSSKAKTNKKKDEVSNQNTEKAVKKPAQKRKSKELNDTTVKRKKVADPVASDVDDDIFDTATYRKPTKQNLKVALSPTTALLSAKKAAGEVQGKATPPCKSIGEMMLNESIHSIMSAAKEAPKQSCLKSRSHNMSTTMKNKREILNDAIKRFLKKKEKGQMKAPTQPRSKPQVKNTREEDFQLKSYSVSNPMSSATLHLLRGRESCLSDMETEDDDDDDDLM